jgi:hypothetical protein
MINPKEQFPALHDFLSAYYHEDWNVNAQTANNVIIHFLSNASASEIPTQIAEEIDELLTAKINDSELNNLIFDHLGCYYSPEADNLTVRDWLASIAKQMRNH